MAVKRSAGLMLHRRNADGVIEVLLVHPGGPFWTIYEAGTKLHKGQAPILDALLAVLDDRGEAGK